MNPLTTEVYGLSFLIKNNKLCFVTRTPQGIEKRYWTEIPEKMLKAISGPINTHIKNQEENNKLTPQQLAEKYKEMMGT